MGVVGGRAETTDRQDDKEEAMMQPRDAHDGDCAMEEAGGHSSPLHPPVMTTGLAGVDASSPSPSSNHHQHEQSQRTESPISFAIGSESAAAAVVGARRRKAVKVVKHQQVSPTVF